MVQSNSKHGVFILRACTNFLVQKLLISFQFCGKFKFSYHPLPLLPLSPFFSGATAWKKGPDTITLCIVEHRFRHTTDVPAIPACKIFKILKGRNSRRLVYIKTARKQNISIWFCIMVNVFCGWSHPPSPTEQWASSSVFFWIQKPCRLTEI